MPPDALTPKQEAFCLAYIETGNASEAYRRAYDAENMSVDAVKVEASNLLKHPNISLTVQGMRQSHQERHNVTVDSLTRELDEDRELARENKQPSAAITAVMGKAKLHGLDVNRHEHKVDVRGAMWVTVGGDADQL